MFALNRDATFVNPALNNHFCSHHTGQPVLASTLSEELEDLVEAKFYCLHAVANDN